MKNLKTFALSALSLFGFAACQQVEIAPDVTPKATHTVTFVAGAPETKTTVSIEESTAKFAWTKGDENKFTAYEDGNAATETIGVLGDDGKMTITATFEGTSNESEHCYLAILNQSGNSTQILTKDAYDEAADILLSKEAYASDINAGVLLQFKREVAIAKMTLKGLDAGENINKVTVYSTSNIAGKRYFVGWSDQKAFLEVHSAYSISEDDADYKILANEAGEAVVWFTCIPQTDATLTVVAEAADGDKYVKEFTKTITLNRGDVTSFRVKMDKLVDPHKDDNGWFLVKDARLLAAGDVIRIGCASAGKVAGALSGAILSSESATYESEQMVSVSSAEDYTLGGTEDAWTLSSLDGKLGATAVKKLSISEEAQGYIGTWTISIDNDGAATIAPNAEGYGRILCNNSSDQKRFTTYTSDVQSNMLLPGIYKKYGTPAVAKKDQTISFDPTSYTATIGKENTYPTLTAPSTGAKTWSSSNTKVATINASTGEITLVAAGTTTISVTVAGDDTYNEGTGSYELTVKTAQVSEGEWVKTDISEISASDIVVIVGSNYGIRNDEGTSSSPDVVSVTITNNKITSVVPDNIKWNISGNLTDGYVFYPNGDTSKWLYCNTTANSKNNDNIRVGTGDRKQWKPDANGYFVNTVGGTTTYVNRVLSINGTSDWRSYVNTNNAPQKLEFYVLKSSGSSEGGSEPKKLADPEVRCTAKTVTSLTFTWGEVANATGYKVSVDGGNSYGSPQTATSYTWEGLTAGTTKILYVKAIGDGTNFTDSDAVSAEGTTTAADANDGSLGKPFTAAEAITAIEAGGDLTNKYVKGVITEVTSFNSQYGSITYTISSGEKTLKVYGGLDLGNTQFTSLEDLKVDDVVLVVGTLSKYNDTTYQFDKNNYLVTLNGLSEIYAGLKVSGQTTTFNVGEDFVFGGTVVQDWRGKDDVDVTSSASFFGYDKNTAGTQTITVTVGDESTTYEITVMPAGLKTVTLQYTNTTTTNMTGGNDAATVGLDANEWSVVGSKGGGSNYPGLNKSKYIAIYYNETESASITVSSSTATIYSIKITYTSNSYNNGKVLVNGNVVTVKDGTYSINSNSFVVTNGNTSNTQVRISSIEITYK